MPSTDILIAFVLATSIFAYMPGPSMLYTAAQTLAKGTRAGWFAALGIHLGGYVHVLAAGFGLAILFQAIPILYVTLKFAGAAYLIWLGSRMILSAGKAMPSSQIGTAHSPSKAFWQSVTVEVLNPKTALFYVAFLPQFTDPGASMAIWAQLLVLGTIVNIMFSSADLICILLAGKMSDMLRRSGRASRVAQHIGGSILIGLGLSIVFKRG